MSRQAVVTMCVAMALVAVVAGQEGGGGQGAFAGNEAAGGVRPPNRFEQFIGKLKVDAKAQGPQVSAVLQAASTEGAGIGQQMAQQQNQLVSALLANKPETELAPILTAYKEQAAKMIGLEARTFAKVLPLGKANAKDAAQAFDIMAGWFQPPMPAGGRGGRGGGGGGRGGAARLDTLIDTFKLTRDQEKAIKTQIDEVAKGAPPVRDALAKARATLAAAIQAGKPQADIDAAAAAYAAEMPTMAALEMRALAEVMRVLTPEQRGNQTGVRSTFFLVRNAFVTRNWNEPPDPDKGY